MNTRAFLPILALALASAASASAQTLLQQWLVNDGTAGNSVGTTITTDMSSGGLNLTSSSSATYSSNTSGSQSTTSALFNGTAAYSVGTNNSENIGNFDSSSSFAVVGWLNLASTTSQWAMLIGNGASYGLGIYILNGQIGVAEAGVGTLMSTSATTGAWTQAAFVVDANYVSLYINGQDVGGQYYIGLMGLANSFSISGDNNGAAPLAAGTLVDDVSVFSFTSGTFTTSMLDYTSAIPEPSTCAAFAGLGALAFVIVRRRRR